MKGRRNSDDEITALFYSPKIGNKKVGEDMAVDWGFAGQIGGIGFGLVFAVLIILALAIWLTGLVLSRIGTGKAEANNKRKED